MEPNTIDLSKKIELTDTMSMFLQLSSEDQKKFYYIMAGFKISEDTINTGGGENGSSKEGK